VSHTEATLLPLVLDKVPRGLRIALEQEGIPTCPHQTGAISGRFLLYDSRQVSRPMPSSGQHPIDVDELRSFFANDPFAALVDQRTARFAWPFAGLELHEEVARVERRDVRRELMARLRQKIERAGGVWLRLSAFPFPYRSALNFRIDYDQYDAADFHRTLAAIEGHEQTTSHYLSGAAYEARPDALSRLDGLDVGSHAYWHHVYRAPADNLRNVGRGIEVLRRAGIEPHGFVAPHGRFNHGLRAALEKLGVTHSSEFALAYDELPFFPPGSSVLQIPVHPVCLGLFFEAAERRHRDSLSDHARDTVADLAESYFQRTARAKYLAGDPVFFYGHPTGRLGRYPRVLKRVLTELSGFAAMWPVTMSQFAAWWEARGQVQLVLRRREDQFELSCYGRGQRYRWGVEFHRGEHFALMPVDGRVLRFSPDALVYEHVRPSTSQVERRRDAAEPLRRRLLRWVDWEVETPLDEIDGPTWRHTAKRVLRRLRGALR